MFRHPAVSAKARCHLRMVLQQGCQGMSCLGLVGHPKRQGLDASLQQEACVRVQHTPKVRLQGGDLQPGPCIASAQGRSAGGGCSSCCA